MGDGVEVLGFDHVTVTAPEDRVEVVLDWYRSVFELQRIPIPEGAVGAVGWFEVGDQQLHLTTDSQRPSKEAHFCVVVDDLEAMIERLRAHGCAVEPADTIPGRRRCYTRDPAGNRIEVMAWDA